MPRPTPTEPKPQLGRKVLFESLEQRILLSADPVTAADAGALDVDLTDGDDNVLIEQIDSDGDTFADDIRVTIGTGTPLVFTDIDSITVDGLEGDDTFEFVNITIDVTVTGGEGSDTLLGSDGSNLWVINDDNTGSLNGLITFSAIENLEGGSGNDTLTGPDANTTWNLGVFGEDEDGEEIVVAAQDAGNLNDEISFSSMENLVGGSEIDEFLFGYGADTGATITGLIDGGTGNNILNFSAYQSAVAINLEDGTSTGGAFVGTVTDVVGGTGEGILDTLTGVAEDSAWNISEAGGGEILGVVVFSNFENLRGQANNRDTFIFEVEGSLGSSANPGEIDGGGGGVDSLMIAKGEDLGGYAAINVNASGSGTVADVFGQTFDYTNLEPIVVTSTTTTPSAAVQINGSVLNERIVIESVTSGSSALQLRSTGADIYDDVGTLLAAIELNNDAAATVTVSLGGGDDTLTIGTIDAAFTGTIDFEGGADFDTLVGANGANTFSIDDLNQGTLNDPFLSFDSVENLVGGSNDDTFVFSRNDGELDGFIDGGPGGYDRLDYSAQTTALDIGINAGNIGIDEIIGSANANDTLVGVFYDSVWTLEAAGGGRVVATSTSSADLDDTVVVDDVNNTLTFDFEHPFFDGDVVRFSDDTADSAGLTPGADYYVLVVNDLTIKLTTAAPDVADLYEYSWSAGDRSLTLTTAPGTVFTLDGTEIRNGLQDTIEFESAHGLSDGDTLTYAYSGTPADDNSGLSAGNYEVVVVDENTIKLLAATPAVVSLTQPADWSTGSRSLINTQQAADVVFSGFENLVAGYATDTFVFTNGGGVGGTIDGGAGDNTLDYSARSDAITVNLGTAGAATTGATGGVIRFSTVIGGLNSGDTLVGPDQDTTWEITGTNAGDVNGVTFTSFENLTGAADNQDGFILRAGGQVSGTIDGGTGGLDGLAIEDPANPGDLTVVIPDATGAGTIAADFIYSGVGAVTFAGMEQPFYADTVGDTTTIYGTPFDDTMLLSQPNATTLTVAETATDRFFWDYENPGTAGSPTFAAKTFGFAADSGGTIAVALSGGDTFSLGAFDPGVKTNLELSGDDQQITGSIATYGGDITINASRSRRGL